MSFMPVGLSMEGKKVVVIGGGSVALHKLRTILRFTHNVTVLATTVLPGIEKLGVKTLRASYRKAYLKGAFLVYACTNDRAVNTKIRRDAREQGVLANIADDKELCDFISPAVYKRGHMVISVSSQGRDVKAAVALRDRIQRYINDTERIRNRSAK